MVESPTFCPLPTFSRSQRLQAMLRQLHLLAAESQRVGQGPPVAPVLRMALDAVNSETSFQDEAGNGWVKHVWPNSCCCGYDIYVYIIYINI
jgi:hypothetical protein